jgi:hypothetical protein
MVMQCFQEKSSSIEPVTSKSVTDAASYWLSSCMLHGINNKVLKIFPWYAMNLRPFEINKTVHMSIQPAYYNTEWETGNTNRELQHTCTTNKSFCQKIKLIHRKKSCDINAKT